MTQKKMHPRPTTILDSRISQLLDDNSDQNRQLPDSIRARIRQLWQTRNACPDALVEHISAQMIALVWPWAQAQAHGDART